MNPILISVLRLVGLTGAGFALFLWKPLRKRALKPLLVITIDILFPLYFVHHFPVGWQEAVEGGGPWYMLAFFLACSLMFLAQFGIGKLLLAGGLKPEQPRQFLLLMTIHNAGFIPLPILASFAPDAAMVYMFFYVLAFNVFFWGFAPAYVAAGSGTAGADEDTAAADRPRVPRFRINPPLVGIALGLMLALTDSYRFVPDLVQTGLRIGGNLSLDLVLVLLGGLLADIPRQKLHYRREFGWLIGIKMVVWPLAFLLVMPFVPLPGLSPEVASAVRLAMVLEAAVPPATNIAVISKAYGSDAQLHYAGAGVIYSYAASALLLPLILIASFALF